MSWPLLLPWPSLVQTASVGPLIDMSDSARLSTSSSGSAGGGVGETEGQVRAQHGYAGDARTPLMMPFATPCFRSSDGVAGVSSLGSWKLAVAFKDLQDDSAAAAAGQSLAVTAVLRLLLDDAATGRAALHLGNDLSSCVA